MDRRQFLYSSLGTGLALPAPASASEPVHNQVAVTDYLGWNWTHELLSVVVTFAPGRQKWPSVAVRSNTGEISAGQLEQIKRHPDGSIAEAVCWFYGDLPSKATRTWVIDPTLKIPPGDLHTERSRDGTQVLGNAILAVKLPAPGAASGAAPILGIRGYDRIWRGTGRLEGPPPSSGPDVKIEASGPVFTRARITYGYPSGGKYEVTLELRSRDEALMVHESCEGVKDASFVFDLGKTFDRGQGKYRLEHEFPLPVRELTISTLIPFFAWELEYWSWFGAHSQSTAVEDWLGFFASHTDSWRGGRWVGLQVETSSEGLRLRLPLVNCERYWGVVASRLKDAVGKDSATDNKCFRAQVRLSQTPLDRVRHMTLRWNRPIESYGPHVLIRPEDLPRVKQRGQQDRDFRRLFEARKRGPEDDQDPAGVYLATGDLAYAATAKQRVFSALRRWIEDFLLRGYIQGNVVAIPLTRPLRRTAIDWDLIAASKVVSDEDRQWADAAFAFIVSEMTDPNSWPPDERGFQKGNVNFYSDHYTCVGALACLLTGHPRRNEWLQRVEGLLNDEFVRWVHPSGAWEEAPNYQGATMVFLIPAIQMLRLAGRTGFTQAESFKATMRFMGEIQTPYDPRRKTAMLPTVGDTSFSFHSQSLQDTFAWSARTFADDPEFAGTMMWHWKQAGSVICGVHDTMAMGRWTSALIMVDPGIRAIEPPPRTSKRLDGFGIRLSQRNSSHQETYLLVKCGAASNHYNPDEMSLHYYTRGVPLVLNYGCMYTPSNDEPWYYNRISIDHKSAGDNARGDITDFVVLDGGDYFAGEMIMDRLTEVPETPDSPYGRANRKPWIPIHPAAWMRQIVLSRAGDYFVLNDTIASDLPTDWSIHCLANGVKSGENMWHFTGQLGVDLDLYLDERINKKAMTGHWGYTGDSYGEDWSLCTLDLPVDIMGETQHFVRLERGPGKGYRALFLPRKPGEPAVQVKALPCGFHLTGDRWREWVLLDGVPTTFDDGVIRFRGQGGLVREQGEDITLCLHSGDRLGLGLMGVEARSPISVTYGRQVITGVSQGAKKRVSVTWPKMRDIRPELLVDGRPFASAHNPIMRESQPQHLLVFTLPPGDHRFEIKT